MHIQDIGKKFSNSTHACQYTAVMYGSAPCLEKPSWLQATAASVWLNWSPQIVPQALLKQISNLPSFVLVSIPSTSLRSPSSQSAIGVEGSGKFLHVHTESTITAHTLGKKCMCIISIIGKFLRLRRHSSHIFMTVWPLHTVSGIVLLQYTMLQLR